MRRYLGMLGMVTLLALPAAVSAETTADVARLAELLARKGVITQQELREVSASAATAPAKAKTDQERDSFQLPQWPVPGGAMW
ncbi:MAG: hypothetical protein HYS14_03320 [Candidatus Rokubacteria bacterium]|nr:hypothetical protein [Candidatus Rokubacteria bacterium]